ncbi:MFS transporter [Levilactobacillus acidifarinae]|uniref:Drug H(+) antiporter n=1 Tax=Levilactobacillus acidifarinae DSM 19394 = JCM 15949 TaxID=1423715 RepID=A0A0R1LU75_9LACO|nr:MFS transporter [Levilactobacillus acidifarinae]KRK95946.1 drug H(+) antiporter [Levilactobacillus acidifarinae DSM 19394]GEO69252.1 MFS transporter [Levilactobacillus acidifarinae]
MTRKNWILTIVLLSYCVTAIDASIVTTGLTLIKHDLQLTQVSLSWIQNAYLLAFGGMVLLGGRLGDLLGRKRVFMVALILFGVGSLFAGISQDASLMISARFVQGIGAALLAPTSLALLMDTFDGHALVKAIAWYSSVSGIGTSIGMVLGGLFASALSWRYGFFINVPLALFMIVVAWRTLPTQALQRTSFDAAGAITSMLALFSLVYTINGATNWLAWGLLTLILLGLFVGIEQRQAHPMLPLSLFTDRNRRHAYLVRALFVGSMMGYFLFAAEYLQTALHFTPLLTGFGFVPLTFVTFLAALRVPDSVARWGERRVALVGMGFLLLGFIMTIPLVGTRNYWLAIGLPMILLGLGQGFAMSPLTNLGIQHVRLADSGAASGLVNAAHQVGGSIGLSLMVALTGEATVMTVAFKQAMVVGLVLNGIGLILTLTLRRDKQA